MTRAHAEAARSTRNAAAQINSSRFRQYRIFRYCFVLVGFTLVVLFLGFVLICFYLVRLGLLCFYLLWFGLFLFGAGSTGL